MSLSVANERLSLPIAYELCLPKTWADNEEVRRKAGIPDDIVFRTKLEIVLEQIRTVVQEGVPRGVVLGDAGYANRTAFRDGITAMGLTYMVGIQVATTVWPGGEGPLPAPSFTGKGRPPRLLTCDEEHQPVSAENLV